jgi:hypothetical protein
MYRDQEREGHFISPELENPMICTGIRKGKVILYFLNLNTPFLIPVHIIGYSSSGDIK